jgi:hypothetical protein
MIKKNLKTDKTPRTYPFIPLQQSKQQLHTLIIYHFLTI